MVPTRRSAKKGTLVPPEGIAVVRGEVGGNTHLLVAAGSVSWAVVQGDEQDLGVVDVETGATAYLLHGEHGANAMGGPGSYLLRRQRQQAEVVTTVAD